MVRDLRSPVKAVLSLALALVAGLFIVQAAWAQQSDPAVFINEFHYDNTGTDAGEFVEIAGPAGTDLSEYSIVLYNGSGGAPYGTEQAFTGTIMDQQNGFGTAFITYPSNGIQNGAPDGIALVGPNDELIQFLSYEGTFTGVGGPADGVTSQDVGVQETGSEPAGQSLQLTGTGNSFDDFTFVGPLDDSPGQPNTGQVFQSVVAPQCSDTVDNDGDGDIDFPADDGCTDAQDNSEDTDGGGEVDGPTRIHDIQDSEQRSPLEDDDVLNVPGVITAFRDFGFFMQDDTPDESDVTSEGIFVFTGSNSEPAENGFEVGDRVVVDGAIEEFRPACGSGPDTEDGCDPGDPGFDNLTETEIETNLNGVAESTEPAGEISPTIIGEGGRTPPNEVIDNDTETGDVENPNANEFEPDEDGIDFYESLEGMQVQVNDAVAVGPTDVAQVGGTPFGEIPVLADNGTASEEDRTARGGVEIDPGVSNRAPGDFNPERIIFDNEVLKDNEQEPLDTLVDVGDTFDEPLLGVISYSFGNFKAQLIARPTPSDTSPERETARDADEGELAVAEYSLENLSPEEDETTFDGAANEIVNNLQSPDLIGLTEVQDNSGDTDNGEVRANQTAGLLIQAIQEAGGPTYKYRDVRPVNNADGGEPGGNIRVGFLFREDRGLKFIGRTGGGSTTPTTVSRGPDGQPRLSVSPGRIDPQNDAFEDSRKPLVGEFRYNDQLVIVIQNHFNSKSEDSPLFGRFQPPLLRSEAQRREQAERVEKFVQQIRAINPDARVIVMGDLNDFEFSKPLRILEKQVSNLISDVPDDDRYTFVFEGNSQVLDHMLIRGSLQDENSGFDIVHASAEFADRRSDHDAIVGYFDIQ